MSLNINREELNKKNKLIDNAIIQLKKEFIGIDEQIDSIMNSVRVWFLFPKLQSSPTVVNVFGMTGCGKTSLIRRIAQLLNIEKDLVYFNFCAINEQTAWEVEQDIEEQLANDSPCRMFVYDEFQYAATLSQNGEEKDNKNGLKPFWELLDTGVIRKRSSYWSVRPLYRVIASMMRINTVCQMEIVNGVWVNHEECLSNFTPYEQKQFKEVFNIVSKDKNGENCDSDEDDDDYALRRFRSFNADEDFFLAKKYEMRNFAELYNKVYNSVYDDWEVYSIFAKMNATEILNTLNTMYEKSLGGYDLKFNESIIFVVANLDEAYDVAFNVNPDMSPDQFHSITKKISIVDVKKALQKRFRNEQIARLGNTHIIYPSFSSDAFKKIIELHLNSFSETAKDMCGLNLEFDNSVNKVVFNEAVYPTHGTRPIFSTIHEIIKTKLPHIISNICENNQEERVNSVRYSYKNKKSIIDVIDSDGNVIDTYKFTDNLRLGKLREISEDDRQANTAVHESGHFVVYSYLNGKTPEKLISKSAESETSGFMMSDADDIEETVGSRIDYLNEIKVCLGGYVAEGIIFGEDRRSSGSSSDLSKATQIASRMVRSWCMDNIHYITTHLNNGSNDGMHVNEDNQDYINEKIKKIVDDCYQETVDIINKPHIMNMLKKSSKYLLKHSQMPKKVMNTLLDEAKANGDIKESNDNYYRNIVNNF